MDPDVQLAANGDVEAFERIYRRHHSRVYHICLRMVRNIAQAEDLTQEVFVQLYRKLHTFRGDAAITTWLHRVTINQVLMHFRRPIVKSEFTAAEESTPVQITNGTERPDRMAVIDHIALKEAIDQLAPGYRLVLLLHDVEGYEHQEIARMLGCAIGTSKSQLHKARLRIRELLAGRKKRVPKPIALTRLALGLLTSDCA